MSGALEDHGYMQLCMLFVCFGLPLILGCHLKGNKVLGGRYSSYGRPKDVINPSHEPCKAKRLLFNTCLA